MRVVVDANVIFSAFAAEYETAKETLAAIDPDDAPFLGLALYTDGAIWSDDVDFEEQSAVEHVTTTELLEHLGLI